MGQNGLLYGLQCKQELKDKYWMGWTGAGKAERVNMCEQESARHKTDKFCK